MKAAVVECLRVVRAHRGRLVLVSFLAAFVAVLFVLSSPRSIEGDDASPPAAGEPVASEPLPIPGLAVSSAQASPDPAPDSNGPPIEKVEVCGAGWVDADADGAVDRAALLASAPMAEASAHLRERIGADGDFGAVTALVLQAALTSGDTMRPGATALVCAAGRCDGKTEDRAAAAELFDRMARLASATSDPRAYSLVLQLCARHAADGPCSALNIAQWAHLDPENGEPWLYILADAVERRDAGAVDDALFHIAAAPRVDDYHLAEANEVLRNAGAADADLVVAEELSTVASVLRVPDPAGIRAVSGSCSYGALSAPNRNELCDKVASALQDRSGSLMTMKIGSAIGRRLGWPGERFETADAIMAAQSDSHPQMFKDVDESRPAASMQPGIDCASIGKMLRYVGDIATLGEREYARRWIERSGKADHYVRLGREQHARTVAREAAEAAQRASAPAR